MTKKTWSSPSCQSTVFIKQTDIPNAFFYPCYICYFSLCCCIHIYLSNTLLFLPEEGSLLCSLLALFHQTVQLHLQLLCVLQNFILQGKHRTFSFARHWRPGSAWMEIRKSSTKFKCVTQRSAAARKAAAFTLSLHSLIAATSRLESDGVAVEMLLMQPRPPVKRPLSSSTWCSRTLFSSSKHRAWKVQCVFRDYKEQK